jgi:hypothetical protein
MVRLDELGELIQQMADVGGRGFAFEDRLLAAEADLLESLGDLAAALGFADVVGDDPFHCSWPGVNFRLCSGGANRWTESSGTRRRARADNQTVALPRNRSSQ